MVDGVLLAIGGEDGYRRLDMTSAICAFNPVDQKWQCIERVLIGGKPFKCSFANTLLLSEGSLLVVHGDSQQVLKIIVVKGKSCCNRIVLSKSICRSG